MCKYRDTYQFMYYSAPVFFLQSVSKSIIILLFLEYSSLWASLGGENFFSTPLKKFSGLSGNLIWLTSPAHMIFTGFVIAPGIYGIIVFRVDHHVSGRCYWSDRRKFTGKREVYSMNSSGNVISEEGKQGDRPTDKNPKANGDIPGDLWQTRKMAYITSKALIYRPASTGALHQKRQQRLDD